MNVILTIFCAFTMPIYVEFLRFYNRIFDILVKFQEILIEFAKKHLWPFVIEILNLINFKSIKQLYDDIKSENKPIELCVSEYMDRAGNIEYIFILLISLLIACKIGISLNEPIENFFIIIETTYVITIPLYIRLISYPVFLWLIYTVILNIICLFRVIFNEFKKANIPPVKNIPQNIPPLIPKNNPRAYNEYVQKTF